jgi:hypothetical protein
MKHQLRDSKGRFAKLQATPIAPTLPALAPMLGAKSVPTERVAKKGSACETCPSYKHCTLSLRQDQ